MPASSQGLPTSLMRSTAAPQLGQEIFTASTQGRWGLWPSKSDQPATARSRSSGSGPVTSKRPAAGRAGVGRGGRGGGVWGESRAAIEQPLPAQRVEDGGADVAGEAALEEAKASIHDIGAVLL